jgi:hypothetical protein
MIAAMMDCRPSRYTGFSTFEADILQNRFANTYIPSDYHRCSGTPRYRNPQRSRSLFAIPAITIAVCNPSENDRCPESKIAAPLYGSSFCMSICFTPPHRTHLIADSTLLHFAPDGRLQISNQETPWPDLVMAKCPQYFDISPRKEATINSHGWHEACH